MKTSFKPYYFSPLALALALSACTPTTAAPAARLNIDSTAAGKPVSPMLYGIFFEEINRAGDGGIYAEMIENRSFEDSRTLFHDEQRRQELGEQAVKESNDAIAWSLVKAGTADGAISLDRSLPINSNNPTSLKLNVTAGGGRVGIANDGFRGIPIGTPERIDSQRLAEWRKRFESATNGGIAVEQGKTYDLSIYARALPGAGALTATLETVDGKVLAKQTIGKPGSDWKKYDLSLKPSASNTKARLVIATETPGTYWLDMVSLFPHDTWKGRKNGLRPDLMQAISAMKPAFVRFPGGCFVEGYYYGEYPRWKDSVGDIAARPEGYAYWGYGLTNGLGYHEYLQMCEDLGAEPLFVINCGMHHAGRKGGVVAEPMEKMGPFVQDALDAIEYANGPVTSKWGALRAQNGHPQPFNLKYMEIGNENGGADYNARYDLFRNAIKAKYPNVELVVCDWGGVPKTPFDYMDSHHYGTPQSFLQQVGRYDNADRNGPKVYFGEYAVTNQAGKGNGQAAVAEAAFLTGLERNSDVVRMSSYAPLLVRKGWDRWNPNAIVFDQSQVYGTPSYWLQTMFAGNRPDRTIPTQVEAATPVENIHGQIGVGTWATQAEFKDIKVTKGTQTLFASNFATGTDGWKTPRGQWSVVDGALRQTGNENNAIALIGDPTWSDYTLTLKARKLSGAEGFLITFGSTDAGTNSWWNIGGWNNTQHGIEYDGVNAPRINGRIENGRWYDIKIELQGQTIKLYLDGQLVQTATRTGVAPLTAVAGRDDKTGETIIKVVNTGAQTLETSINLNGIKAAPLTGTAWTLNCPNRLEENSFEAPTKIAPKAEQLSLTGPSFTRVFPAQSVTVMRLKAAH